MIQMAYVVIIMRLESLLTHEHMVCNFIGLSNLYAYS